MNRREMFVGVVGTFALALGLVAARPVLAQNSCTSTTIDVTGYGAVNACSGEFITLTSGTETTTVCMNDDKHATATLDLHAMGMGDHGNTYVLFAHQVEQATANAQGLYEFNVNFQLNFISQGSAPNVVEHCSERITIAPSGQMNVEPLGCVSRCNG